MKILQSCAFKKISSCQFNALVTVITHPAQAISHQQSPLADPPRAGANVRVKLWHQGL